MSSDNVSTMKGEFYKKFILTILLAVSFLNGDAKAKKTDLDKVLAIDNFFFHQAYNSQINKLYLIDDIERDYGFYTKLDVSDILLTYSLPGDPSVIDLYGAKAQNGVIIVQTKSGQLKKIQGTAKPVILNGSILNKQELAKLTFNGVKSVKIVELDSTKAKKLLGNSGKKGAISVEIVN